MRRASKLTLSVAALVSLGCIEAASQEISGVVRDDTGRPLRAALVELLDSDGVVVSRVSGTSGEFAFDRVPPGVRAVRGSLIGFQPRLQPVDERSRQKALLLVLTPQPIALPGLEIVTSTPKCPEGSPRADEIWSAVKSSYEMPPPASHWGAAIVELRRGETELRDFGRVSPARYMWAVAGGTNRAAWSEEALERDGFARPTSGLSLGQAGAWDYVDLAGPGALLVFTDAFRKLHEFGVIEEAGDGSTVIGFCPRNNRKPATIGRVVLSKDLRVLRLEWRYTTPEPRENAGGLATFAGDERVLLPRSAVSWRETSNGRYYQQAARFTEWFLGAEGEVMEGLATLRSRASNRQR